MTTDLVISELDIFEQVMSKYYVARRYSYSDFMCKIV